ncbi:Transcription termination factor MTERF6 chloroplastic/mitochondrial [Bienertia sinuspersici]
MTFHFLRRTLISLSRKHEPSVFIDPSSIPLYPLFSSSISTLVTPSEESASLIKDHLITHHNFSLETALKLEKLVLCDPNVLSADLNKSIKIKVKKLEDLGFTDIELASLLCNVSGVLTLPRNADYIASSISVLQSVVCSNVEVIRLLKTCNWFLCSDLNNVLLPNIELMENCGISKLQIRRMIFSFQGFS